MKLSFWLRWGVAFLVTLAGSHVQAQSPPAEPGIFSCVDARGRKLTSDRPIPECLDREQKVLNPSGTVKSRVGPSLTAQERAEIELKEKEAAKSRALQVDEKRRERALLIRYPTKEVHDKERAQALTQVGLVIQTATQRLEDLRQDRRKQESEMEFYKKNPSKTPATINRQIEEVNQGIAAQERFIGEQQNEIRRINARFDEELARLNQLWFAQLRSKPAAVTTKSTP